MSTNSNLANNVFQKQLAFGQIAETRIAKWLILRGLTILPAYDKEYDDGKGPRVFFAAGNLVVPDFLVFSKDYFGWIEAKHKSVFTWYGKGGYWTTGIDRHHFNHYVQVHERLKLDVWILFLHICSTPDRRDRERWEKCPEICPTGLFGAPLSRLTGEQHSHESDKHGRSGMRYWGLENEGGQLGKIAKLSEIPE